MPDLTNMHLNNINMPSYKVKNHSTAIRICIADVTFTVAVLNQ